MNDDYRNQNIKLWTDGVTTLAAYDLSDVARLHDEAGITLDDPVSDDLWEPLDNEYQHTVHLHPWSPAPAGAIVEVVEVFGDGWTRKATAPAWMWANCAAEQGNGWAARFISSNEW